MAMPKGIGKRPDLHSELTPEQGKKMMELYLSTSDLTFNDMAVRFNVSRKYVVNLFRTHDIKREKGLP